MQLAVMQAVSIDWCMVLLILLYIHVVDIVLLFLVVPLSYKLSTVRTVNESSWDFIQGLVEAGLMSGGCDAIQFDDSTEFNKLVESVMRRTVSKNLLKTKRSKTPPQKKKSKTQISKKQNHNGFTFFTDMIAVIVVDSI